MIQLAIFEKLMLGRVFEVDEVTFGAKETEPFVVKVFALLGLVSVDLGRLVDGFFCRGRTDTRNRKF